jgi:hypothetical protein
MLTLVVTKSGATRADSLPAVLAVNAHNFVRASTLQPFSVEMIALLCGLILAYRYRRGGLLAWYVLSLPFTDVVYRVGPLLISDILGVALLLQRGRRGRPWLVSPLFFWIGWGFAINLVGSQSLFSISYAIRFAIILLVAGLSDLSQSEARTAVAVLRAVTILAAVISALQVILWRLGLPIDGVFAALGFVRPKGLAHEPSTSAAFFAMAIPLLMSPCFVRTERRRHDWPLLIAIVVGLGLTASLSGLLIAGVILFLKALRAVARMPARALLAAIGVVVLLTGVGLYLFRAQTDYLTDKVAEYVDEYARDRAPATAAVGSGREGDLYLLHESKASAASGTGIFTSTETADRLLEERNVYVPAANIVVTTFVETGAVGLLLFLVAMTLVAVGVVRDLRSRSPDIVGGFFGFLAVLIGQRLLAFPQPWFMLALGRGLDPELAAPERIEQRPAPTVPTAKGERTMSSVSAQRVIRQYWRSILAVTVVGLILVGIGASRLGGGTTAEVRVGLTGQGERLAALELPESIAPEFDPDKEAVYVSSAFETSAVPQGTYVAIREKGSSLGDAKAKLEAITVPYLKTVNASWTAALQSARALVDQKVQTFTAQLADLDRQLADPALAPDARVPIAIERSTVSTSLSTAQLQSFSYSQISGTQDAVGVITGPDQVSSPNTRLLLLVTLGVFVVLVIAFGQAWWRAASKASL